MNSLPSTMQRAGTIGAFSALLLATSSLIAPAGAQDLGTSSLNNQITVVPAPGAVTIDGKTDDWDLSAGIWSYNDPTLVEKYSLWTHLMWDDKGIYWLARHYDKTPLQNATQGKNFALSWKADAYQARVVFDDQKPDEHQMHINIFYSTPEKRPYMIVKHGGFKAQAPFDGTGPDRPDLLEKFGVTMEEAGGKIAFSPWADGTGYTAEAFWPWKYARVNGQPLKPGESFVFGLDAIWGNADGTGYSHRLVDNMRDATVNRIFFFRDRKGWGKAVISDKGNLGLTKAQETLQEQRLKQFVDFDTYGSIPVKYELPTDGDVTIAIDNEKGERVRNLFGQYPRKKGLNTDVWDGLDDKGTPVPPGKYSVTIVDHQPVKIKVINSVYNAAVPPWITEGPRKLWGANHGHPTTVATRGDVTLVGFTGVEGATGLLRADANGIIQWTNVNEVVDVTLDGKFAYTLGRDWAGTVDLRRINLTDGQLTPFTDTARSPKINLPIEAKNAADSSSIALVGGKLFVFVPGQKFYRVAPDTGQIEATLNTPDLLAVTERGDSLYGLFAGGKVALLNAEGQTTKTLFTATNLKKPMRLAVSQDALRFAVSEAEGDQVLVFDGGGKLLQTLGKPYTVVESKRPPGAFVDTNFRRPMGLDFDPQNRLWVAEAAASSRRVTMWTPDGKLAKQFWGGPNYGATSAFPLTFDSTRFLAQGIEFQLDPNPDFQNRPTAEKPLMFHPELAEERGYIYRLGNHEYAVNTSNTGRSNGFFIALRDKSGVFVPRVRVKYGTPKVGRTPAKLGTAWTDKNLNGMDDPGETVEGVQGRSAYWVNGWTRPDLTVLTADQWVYAPQGFTPDGVPLYDFSKPQKPQNAIATINAQGSAGTAIMDAKGNISDGISYATVDGKRGTYPNRFKRHDAPAAQRGVLIAPFRTNGVVENVPGVGAITALGGDRGEWFLMSMDGLYLSSIGQDIKGEVTLDETFIGQESFGGFIWRDEKGRVLAQLGGPSYRIVELTDLDTTRKNTQTVEINAAQIAEGQRIASARRMVNIQASEPERLTIARVAKLPTSAVEPDAKEELIPGTATFQVQEPGDPNKRFRAAFAHDGQSLAVMWQVNDASPWKNGEGRYTHAFVGGDNVDLKLDIPGRGPIRILSAPVGGQNTVAYWQKTAPQQDNPTVYAVGNNMTNAQRFDVVKRLDNAHISVQRSDNAYSVLLTIPLVDLGLDAAKTREIKGIIGVIFSDPAGQNRASRLYWHDKNTGLVSDVPSEASLNTNNWGTIEIAP
jgi:hypothetical protein